MKTYLNSVRSFDHRELADLPAYTRLRQVLDDLAHEVEERELRVTLDDWLSQPPYADCCERCGQRAWPHAVPGLKQEQRFPRLARRRLFPALSATLALECPAAGPALPCGGSRKQRRRLTRSRLLPFPRRRNSTSLNLRCCDRATTPLLPCRSCHRYRLCHAQQCG